MFQFFGWLNEKLGRSVNKVMLLKPIGNMETESYKIGADFLPVFEDKVIKKQIIDKATNNVYYVDETVKVPVMEKQSFRQFCVIRQLYFTNSEQTWRPKIDGQEKAYILNVKNTAYRRSSVNVQFVDAITGNGVNMSGLMVIPPEYNPDTLSVALQSKHLVAYINQHKQQVAWVFLAIGVVLGVFVGFVIAQNLPAIQSAISNSSSPGVPSI